MKSMFLFVIFTLFINSYASMGTINYNKILDRGAHHLESILDTTCTTPDQYYKIAGTWIDGSGSNNNFTFDGTGKITYVGESGRYFLFNGASDIQANKVSRVTYALYINGALATGAETPADIKTANASRNISITHVLQLTNSDYFEIFVKSDTASTVVKHNTLFLTFWGDR